MRIPGVAYGFGTRASEVSSDLGLKSEEWQRLRPKCRQVHGAVSVEIVSPSQECFEADAFWTEVPGLPIGVATADCVPVLLARRDGKRVAAIHAGWRGTRARIIRALWVELSSSGEKADDWVGVVGPAIGPCCYEVSEEIAADFQREFAAFGEGLAVPRPRILDLQTINEQELRALGFHDVEVVRECTRCTCETDGSFKYNSYRREGSGTRQYSIIKIESALRFS